MSHTHRASMGLGPSYAQGRETGVSESMTCVQPHTYTHAGLRKVLGT